MADVVITMGRGDTCPYIPGTRHEDWPLADPAAKDIEFVRGSVTRSPTGCADSYETSVTSLRKARAAGSAQTVRLRLVIASAVPAATSTNPPKATGPVDPPVLGSEACGLTIIDGFEVVGVVDVARDPTVVDVVDPLLLVVVVVDPRSPIVVEVEVEVVDPPMLVVVTGATVVVVGATVVVVGATVVVVVGATVVVVGATVVVVVGATVVVVVGATVVVVVGATVVVVVGATVVVVVGATVVVVVGATVVVVVGATVVVVVGATVVVVVGATVVVVVGATVVVVVGATVVVVVGATVVVVVPATLSGNWIDRNDWSAVIAVLFVDTRIWQLR